MNLKVIVLPAKVLVDGTHRVRIAMSHRGTTRYFNTRFKVPSPKNVVDGQIVGVPNANYMNMRLLQKVTDIYKVYDDLEDVDYYTCSQLLAIIEERIKGGELKTFRDVVEEFSQNKKHGVSARTMRIVSFAIKAFYEFFKADFFLKRLDSQTLYAFRDFMTKRGLNNSTQSIYFQILREVVNYAIKHKYVKYEVSPFMDFEEPKPLSRNVAVSIEELRTIRDEVFTGKSAAQITFVRDLFMLSFYMCGMNLVDLLRLDYSGDYVHFLRQKTQNRRPDEASTEFSIQPEARAILDRIYKDGEFVFNGKPKTRKAYNSMLQHYIPEVGKQCGIKKRLIFYSARKTFAQLSNELMIKDSIIEYCIGDAVTNDRRVIGSYIRINKRMADFAIRKVFDAVASEKKRQRMNCLKSWEYEFA